MEISSKPSQITWHSVSESVSRIKGMTSDEILDCEVACEELKQKLGEEILSLDILHPLGIKYACNKVAWTHRWLTWFSKELNRIESFVGFDALIHAIKQPDKFYDAVTSVEIAELLQSTNGEIQFERNHQTVGKQPDLVLILDLKKIYIEHSTCTASEQEAKSADSSFAIMMGMSQNKPIGIHYSGRIFRPFAKPKHESVVKAFASSMLTAQVEGFCEIAKDTWYEFAASNSLGIERLKHWADSRGLQVNGFSGSGYPDGELNRVRVKLRRKANGGQIPKTSKGIIVIRNNRLFYEGESRIPEVVSSLEEEIYEYQNIVAVVILGSVPKRENGCYSISDSQISFRNRSIFHTECAVYIPNNYRESVMSESITSKLMKSFNLSLKEQNLS